MNPRRNRPNSSVYWSHSTAKRPNAKRSQSTVNVHQNEYKYESKLRLLSSKSACPIKIHTPPTPTPKTQIEKSKSQVSLAEFRLLHRQSRPCSLLRRSSLPDKTEKKYLIKGAGMLKSNEEARDCDKQNELSQPVNIEDEIDENIMVGPNTSLVELRRKKSTVQNFQYADLNPNYLIDQYYYTRKALNKAEAAKLKMQDRMEDDRRKLKLANHVIKEMKKIADSGPNKSHSKGGRQPIKAQLFFKDYYTDTADMGTQFTRERKVKIWLNNCNFHSRTSISDISNAWTNMI